MNNEEFVNNEIEPLEQWYCDSCDEIISKAKDGWLESYKIKTEDGFGKLEGFRIVHHDEQCMYNSNQLYRKEGKLTSDMHLDNYIGSDGLVNLLSYVHYDLVKDNEEIVEIIRRLHVPYYEEARRYHDIAERDGYFDGENEVTRYLTRVSKYILNNYKQQDI